MASKFIPYNVIPSYRDKKRITNASLLGLPEFKYSTTPEPVDYLAGQGAVEPIFGPSDIIPDTLMKYR
jgi:hypothetical protein